MTASDGGLAGATSNAFNIASMAAKLAFGQQPNNRTAGHNITPAVTVLIEDSSGNIVTTNNTTVTLVFGNNPGGGT